MLSIRNGHAADAVVTVAEELYPEHVVSLGRLVEAAKEIVEGLHELLNRQRHGQP